MAPGSGIRPGLPYLPRELIYKIISDPQFSRQDLKNLRLICRSFEQPVASILFRWVKMSRLTKDREAFEAIASSPHLAQHVRQIVWQELHLEAWDSPDEDDSWIPEHIRPEPSKVPSDAGSVDSEMGNSRDTYSWVSPNISHGNITRLMNAAAKDPDLFWIPISRNPVTHFGEYTHIDTSALLTGMSTRYDMSTFLARFAAAIQKMPELTTLRTCPMPHNRVFYYRGYPLRADLYRYKSNEQSKQGNSGFFNFMLPIMRQAGNKITSLHWADEPSNESFLLNLRVDDSHVFRALTSIDLCIAGTGHQISSSTLGMGACLSSANNLKHLSLCFEQRTLPQPMFLDRFRNCHWPHLESFEMSNAIGIQQPTWASFFKKHAGSLRHLSLVMCDITPLDLMAIRLAARLQLETVKLVCFDADEAACLDADSVLAYLIRKEPFISPASLKEHFQSVTYRSYLATEISNYDHHRWCMEGMNYGPYDVRHCEHIYDEDAADSKDDDDNYYGGDDTDTSSDSSSESDSDYDAMDDDDDEDFDDGDSDDDDSDDDEESSYHGNEIFVSGDYEDSELSDGYSADEDDEEHGDGDGNAQDDNQAEGGQTTVQTWNDSIYHIRHWPMRIRSV